MGCYDIEGNSVDCNDPATIASGEIGYSPTDYTITANNPVAAMSGSSNGGGPSSLSTFLNFFQSVAPSAIAAGTGTTSPSGVRLQVNPATGLQQYYNPSTGQYVGSAITPNTSLLSGSNSFLWVIVALVVAFFAFGGRKRLAAA